MIKKLLITLVLLALAGCAPSSLSEAGGSAEATPIVLNPDQPVSSNDSTPSSDEPAVSGQYSYAEAGVESIEILMLESFPVQVHVVAKGNLAESCTEIDATTIERSGNTFQVKLTTRRPAGQMCAQAVVPYQEIIPLDVADLSAGEYIVNVNGVTDAFTFEVDNTSPKTAPQPTTASEITISPNGSTGFSRIKIYLVALDDNGQNGPKIGCGDSLVAVEREITPTLAPLRAAIEELLAVHEQYYGQSGLYNALYQSDLHLENVAIDEHGKTTIHLSG
ncbi:MAG TPA: hypothetical protein VEC93_13565, partial [Anaerolineae bacterium]|nr:hypothetical protein [Anaerolineae bacterium]